MSCCVKSHTDLEHDSVRNSGRYITVDVGNTAMKFGLFGSAPLAVSHYPQHLGDYPALRITDSDLAPLARWLETDVFQNPSARLTWGIAGVHREKIETLGKFLRFARPQDEWRVMSHAEVPILNRYQPPESVGIDRLLAACGADTFFASRSITDEKSVRPYPTKNQSVLVVDAGTAVKIDLVIDGVFTGGVILPGIETAATALAAKTDLLPQINAGWGGDIEYPATNTDDAIRGGIRMSIVGAVVESYKAARRLCNDRQSDDRRGDNGLYDEKQNDDRPSILLTGGDARRLEKSLDRAFAAQKSPNELFGPKEIVTLPDVIAAGILLAMSPKDSLCPRSTGDFQ